MLRVPTWIPPSIGRRDGARRRTSPLRLETELRRVLETGSRIGRRHSASLQFFYSQRVQVHLADGKQPDMMSHQICKGGDLTIRTVGEEPVILAQAHELGNGDASS